MVAAARADVADGHPRPYGKQPRELAGLVKGITLPLRGAAWAYDLRNGAFRLGKRARRFTSWPEVGDLKCVAAAGARRENREHRKRNDDVPDPHVSQTPQVP